jgi:hypothetical protein
MLCSSDSIVPRIRWRASERCTKPARSASDGCCNATNAKQVQSKLKLQREAKTKLYCCSHQELTLDAVHFTVHAPIARVTQQDNYPGARGRRNVLAENTLLLFHLQP